jgi:hypothetical protein
VRSDQRVRDAFAEQSRYQRVAASDVSSLLADLHKSISGNVASEREVNTHGEEVFEVFGHQLVQLHRDSPAGRGK